MIDPINVNAKTQREIVKRLFPSMLFLIIMTIVSGYMGRSWSKDFTNEVHGIVAFYGWFIGCLIMCFFGCFSLYKDSQINEKKPKGKKRSQPKRSDVSRSTDEAQSG
ncbi:hypothetical protein [Bacillus cereus group sp. BY8-1LC]|uniref:hypothetical protein n=1 Tax=Bacillus cereus group sp. BY8-1LC TaxID=3018076 RepID=UPI0022E3A1FB|nr:hypothetical protein [Bacillus cereus group sp. BY8-1LC]MDA1797570.1 hypothetical protein [Bacillus cereus group sp. BY8-1LC]